MYKISRTSEFEAKKSRAIPPSISTEGKNGRRMLYNPTRNRRGGGGTPSGTPAEPQYSNTNPNV
jgi:hypothetical protein